ncbi:hypothetical protein PDESU_05676 [Pontiella desulfatans]|uniref:LamG-like jellyroll fold domain-containing protein n=1 Tax=Pontiella desulfatans TaxID=2750659 RepID=A0A6C2UCC3_PONDE|nr:LamG domain-containing protein [Pontiella desulfatans]VGO17081.1 hypothetical protein PDESU_05676 [Pontiella desulfatans]
MVGKFGVMPSLCALVVFTFCSAGFAQSNPIENQGIVTVSGAWNVSTNLWVGLYTGGNGLVVTNGGEVSTAYYTYVGHDAASDSNRVVIAGAGSEIRCNGTRVGLYGSNNSLRIEDGGKFYSSISGYYSAVGDWQGSDHNTLVVDGAGSLWDANYVAIGNNSSFNSLIVTNGGYVFADVSMLVGRRSGAANNKVVVTGAGSKVDVAWHLYLGCQWSDTHTNVTDSGGSGNTVRLEDGGVMDVVGFIFNRNQSRILLGEEAKLYCGGNYTQVSGADLQLTCAPDPLKSSQLIVSGIAELGGDLALELSDGFVPADGYSVKILSISGQVSGQFDSVVLPELPPDLTWELSKLYTEGTVSVAGPGEPSEVNGYKWLDLNTNGIWDAEEPPLENWTIYADLNTNLRLDDEEPFDLTDASGSYSLLVPSGNRMIGEVVPADWMQTFPGGTGEADYSNTLSRLNSCYAPNILSFGFTKLPPASGDGMLSVYAIADLNSSSEYLGLVADGQSLGNLFVSGGTQMSVSTTDVVLEQSMLNGWLADQSISFQATPSSYVANLGSTVLRLTLSYPTAGGLHSLDLDSGSIVTNLNFGNMITGLYVRVDLPVAATEGDGELIGQLQLRHPAYVDTPVALSSDAPTALAVPTNAVVVPAGESNAVFSAWVLDDARLDGTQPITVRATSPGYQAAVHQMIIHDNETAAMTLSLPQTTFEGAGTISGVLQLDRAPDTNIVVELVSNNPGKIGGASIVVPTGQTFVSFSLPVVDNAIIDGVQTATIEARVENWTSVQAFVFVFDNETTGIGLQLPASLSEGDGIATNAGTVTLTGTTPVDVNVLLTASDPYEIGVPMFVTVPAGTNSAPFDIVVIDDAETDGTQQVSLLAEAPGYVPAQKSLNIADNDVHHLEVGLPEGDLDVATPVALSVTAKTIDGFVVVDYAETLNLTASGDEGAVPVDPSLATNAVGGVISAEIAFGRIANKVQLFVEDGLGMRGTSTVFNVLGSLVSITPAALTNTWVEVDAAVTRTLVVSNAGNADLEFEIPGVLSGGGAVTNAPIEGLVADYPFNGNALDETGNGFNGTVVGAALAADRNGNADSAYGFDGVDDYIELGNSLGTASTTFTVSAWMNSSNPRYQILVSKKPSGIWLPGQWQFFVNASQVSFGFCNQIDSLQQAVVDVNLHDGEWHHVCGILEANRSLLYVDGQAMATNTSVGLASQYNIPIRIGDRNNSSGRQFFDGLLDDVQIYDRALNASEVAQLYNAPQPSSIAIDANLVVNGDFEGGNVGFKSAYVYTPASNSAAKGIYTVADDSLAWNGSFATTMKDHTSGAGQMLMATGSSAANTVVWQQDVAVVAGETYDFSAWTAGLSDLYLATLDFRIDGASIGSVATENHTWKPFAAEWMTTNSGTVTLSVVDTMVIPPFLPFGNSFALDDISFALVGGGETNPPDEGLVAHYPFNGNASDESGNGHDGAVNGATLTADRFGNPNSAYLFDGTDDYIAVADHVDLRLSNTDFSISAWFNESASNPSSLNTLLAKRNPYPTQQEGWMYGITGQTFGGGIPGKLRYFVSSGSDPYCTGNAIIPQSTWHHSVMTYEVASGTISFYVDGVLDSQHPGMPVPNASTSMEMNIGRDSRGADNLFHGIIDDIQIYNRALSATEVADLYEEKDDGGDDPWLTVEPASGTVPPGGSVEVAVTFNANGLNAGEHLEDVLQIICNDAFSPTNPVPVSMDVIGGGITLLPGHLDFGSLEVGLLATNALAVVNSATNEVGVQLACDNPYFVLPITNTLVQAGQTVHLPVWFNAQRIGTNAAVLTCVPDADTNKTASATLGANVYIVSATNEQKVITFDPAPVPNDGATILGYGEKGYGFAIPNYMYHYDSGRSGVADNGTGFLLFNTAGGSPLVIAPTNGATFSVLRIDLSEYSMSFDYPAPVAFKGNKADGGEVSVTFSTDGAMDGPGGDADFETFVFPAEFTDLVSLEVASDFYGMDNLEVVENTVIMPLDAYLAWRGGYLPQSAAGSGLWEDFDGDGQNNFAEFIAGMDPTNPASCFMVDSVNTSTNGAFVLNWESVTGRVYSVQWKESMTNGFQHVESNLRHPRNSYTDTVHRVEGSGFYSIEVELD